MQAQELRDENLQVLPPVAPACEDEIPILRTAALTNLSRSSLRAAMTIYHAAGLIGETWWNALERRRHSACDVERW